LFLNDIVLDILEFCGDALEVHVSLLGLVDPILLYAFEVGHKGGFLVFLDGFLPGLYFFCDL
jgi:hypothetical protein